MAENTVDLIKDDNRDDNSDKFDAIRKLDQGSRKSVNDGIYSNWIPQPEPKPKPKKRPPMPAPRCYDIPRYSMISQHGEGTDHNAGNGDRRPRSREYRYLDGDQYATPYSHGSGQKSATAIGCHSDYDQEYNGADDTLYESLTQYDASRGYTQKPHGELEDCSASFIQGERSSPGTDRLLYDPYRLKLTGIPDGVTHGILTLFIDGHTKMNEDPEILYGETPETVVVTYPTRIKDIDTVVQNFKERKLQGSFITACRVPVTDGILVQNLKPGSWQESIELYFESKKDSDGDTVREVHLFESKNQAVVYFENYEVVERVLRRTHTLEGFNLIVTPFYEFLGTDVSTDRATPRVPNPEVIDVDPSVADYIFNESQIKSQFQLEMGKLLTKVEWQHDQDKSKIKLMAATTGSSDRLVWETWKEDAIKGVKDFFAQYETREYRVNRSFGNEICEILSQRNLQHFRAILKSTEGVIVLQGKSEHVNEAVTIIANHSKTVTETMPMNSDNFKLFRRCRIKEEIEQRWPNVTFTFDASSNNMECEGMQSEVVKAKLELSNSMNNLCKSSVDVSPLKCRFLNDVEEQIHDVLFARNIQAAYHTEEFKVMVTGKTNTDIDRATEYISTEIVDKELSVENKSALFLQSEKGQNKLEEINSQNAALVRLNDNSTRVTITGFVKDVDSILAIVGEFIEDNVIIEGEVRAKKGELRFILEHKSEELQAISKEHAVTIDPEIDNRPHKLTISGTKQGLTSATKRLQEIKDNIVNQQNVVAKTGIPQVLRSNTGQIFLKEVEKKCNCVVEFDACQEDAVQTYREDEVQTLRQHTLPGGCVLMVCKGDLTLEQVDVIVNAANTDLRHTGGLAKAIVDAGGESIQTESNDIILKKGRLNTGEVVKTRSGRLPCNIVFHVAGPKWDISKTMPKSGDSPRNEEHLLWNALTNVLKEAKDMKIGSLSIPAISSGIYRFPIDLCAKILVQATIDFCEKNRDCRLKQIRFTNNDDSACDEFLSRFEQEFDADDNVGSITATRTVNKADDFVKSTSGAAAYGAQGPIPSISRPLKQVDRCTLTTKENKTISLKKADITVENVDVIVNTTGSDVNLNAGGVSKAILSAAGRQIQRECKALLTRKGLTRLDVGGILETGPAALRCKAVYHIVCCSYNVAKSESVLYRLVRTVLERANTSKMKSIAFPAIGTGNLGFPHSSAAEQMYGAVIEFSQQNPVGSLADIRFVLFNKDRPAIQAFEAEMQQLTQHATIDTEDISPRRKLKKPSEDSGQQPYGGDRKPKSDIMEMPIGKVLVKLCCGDLTNECTEAIVNSTGPGFDLQGPVSQAIIRAGGTSIAQEVQKLSDKGDVIKTGAGTMGFKCIIHVVTPQSLDKLKEVVEKALRLAEKERCKSIAFPALGTGNNRGDPVQAAGYLHDAFTNFAESGKAKHLLLIKMTIFQPALMKLFQDQWKLKEEENAAQKRHKRGRGIFGRFRSSKASSKHKQDVSKSGEPSVESEGGTAVETILTLHVYAGQESDLRNAEKKIGEYIDEQYARKEIMLDRKVWGELDEMKLHKIESIAAQHSVQSEHVLGGKAERIEIEGRKENVYKTIVDVNEYLKEIQLERQREMADNQRKTEDRLTNKEVEWRYYDPATGLYTKYGEEINPLLERAFQESKDYVDLELEDGKIRIDFKSTPMNEVNGRGRKTDVQRIDLERVNTLGNLLPQNWTPMNPGQNTMVVPLQQTTKEYDDIKRAFKATIGLQVRIIQINRIQNEDLHKRYAVRRDTLSASAKHGIQVERYAYHGTAETNFDKINNNGFNRSYRGVNGTAYGEGTYFARDANYSHRYAKTSGQTGYRHMFYCKILTGEYTIGNSKMIAPPAKPNNPTELYDSVVDQHPNPSIFVIFHDAQAYPEYLIIYK